MSKTQKILLAVYLPATLLVLYSINFFPSGNTVFYLKYAVIVSLFIASISIHKKYREQKYMAASFFFVAIADFCLVFSATIEGLWITLSPYGIVGFLFAYLCLIAAYNKNFKIGRAEIITAIPIVIVFLYTFMSLQPYLSGFMFIGALIFGLVLCYMTWSAICTIYRGYFSKKASYIIALSGSLMFICDIGVAFSLFYPNYFERYSLLFNDIVWAAYIIGWTLLVVAISEKNLLTHNDTSNK